MRGIGALLMLGDETSARGERNLWIVFAMIATVIALGFGQGPTGRLSGEVPSHAAVLPPVPAEQTLDIRTLVQPDADHSRLNAGPRSDI
jgi:hypothetical protein